MCVTGVQTCALPISSQTGTSALKLKAALADTEDALREYAELEGKAEDEIDPEDALVKELTSHGRHKNLSFFAFTATPKAATLELFGKSFRYPFFAGPVGAVNLHYSDTYTDMTYNDVLVRACAESGIAAFTGDGTNPDVMTMATKAIGNADGCGVPTIKPWNIDTIKEKMAQAKASGCFAVAMDVDAAGLPFLKNMTPPAGSKSVAELAEIVKLAERPFIVKGVMTVKGALKAKEAGAAAIVVSNHGGRVLDQCPATAEVLPEIAAALKGTGVKVLVDGGIRTGVDVFKALALGADGVLICRPFVTAVYGGGEEGVKCYIDKLAGELADTMQMCGAHSISEITADMVRV